MSEEQSTFLQEEHHANPSLSQASVREWMTSVVNYQSDLYSLLSTASPNGLSGKTSPVSSVVIKDETLEPSCGRWLTAGIISPTECWTHSTLESPNDAEDCSLSEILQMQDVPPQYYLSQRACKGILRRAEKRGKKLPDQLKQALQEVANRED